MGRAQLYKEQRGPGFEGACLTSISIYVSYYDHYQYKLFYSDPRRPPVQVDPSHREAVLIQPAETSGPRARNKAL